MAIQGAPTGLWVRYLHVSFLALAELHITCYSMQGAKETAKIILRTDGIPGLYRGFGTVVFGAIPARIVSHPLVGSASLFQLFLSCAVCYL